MRIASRLDFGDLYTLTISNEYWKIKSLSMVLNGYGRKRLYSGKYSNGISRRLEQLSIYYGHSEEWSVSKNDIIVDIGANIGEFSLFCLRKGAKVLSVEPDPIILKCTRANLQKYRNSLGIEASIISDNDGLVDFYQAPSRADSSILKPEKYDQKIKINSITLDSLYERYNLELVHLIKCDAEGAEPEVFSRASRALEKTKIIAVNCGPERYGKTTISEVSKILVRHGFENKIIDGYKPMTVVIGINKRL